MLTFSLLFLASAAAAETSKPASECITDYALGSKGCIALSAFAYCVAKAPHDDGVSKP